MSYFLFLTRTGNTKYTNPSLRRMEHGGVAAGLKPEGGGSIPSVLEAGWYVLEEVCTRANTGSS